jgi:transposase, IS5 family
LIGQAGPEVFDQLNTALVGKLSPDRILRARKLRIDTTVVEADIDHPTDTDLLSHWFRIPSAGVLRRPRRRPDRKDRH